MNEKCSLLRTHAMCTMTLVVIVKFCLCSHPRVVSYAKVVRAFPVHLLSSNCVSVIVDTSY